MNWNGDRTPADLTRVEERLRAERVTATALELDTLKLRAQRQGAPAAPQLRGNWMKSRLALTLMIVSGLMMGTTGATLAVQGSSGNGNAATNQYNNVNPKDEYTDDTVDDGETLGANEDDSTPSTATPSATQAEVASDTGGDSLPFTGFLAIPLLIGGVALLSTGTVMRWRTRSKE